MMRLAFCTFSSGLLVGMFWNSDGSAAVGWYLLLVAALWTLVGMARFVWDARSVR